MHVCVDDYSRLAYAEVLADEKTTTAIGFLERAVRFYRRRGIRVERLLTDNGSAYVSAVHALACRRLRIRHSRTRPYRPQTNGKAERFIRTLLAGWAYGAIYRSSQERTAAAAYTNTARYVVRPVGAALAGVAQRIALGLPFLIGGGLKAAYDAALYVWFRRVRVPEG